MIKIALLSDLHAYSGNLNPQPSRLGLEVSQAYANQHPITGLLNIAKQDPNFRADYLMCAGDMCDRADAGAVSYIWSELEKIQKQLEAKHLFATAGNHDIDSRYSSTPFDPKGLLQKLRPHFPGLDETFSDKFWARNFAVYEDEFIRVVVLNTCAFHGYGKPEGKPEFLNGRVSNETIDRMQEYLATSQARSNNILLCHHHPITHNLVNENDYSVMLGGDRLIELLNSLSVGPWIIIHGHKHHPRLSKAPGDSLSPLVLSLGSFSAYLHNMQKNQFYILELESTAGVPAHPPTKCRGRIRAWDWADGVGWSVASLDSGIPGIAGFGFQGAFDDLVKDIAEFVKGEKTYKTFDELVLKFPDLPYLLPTETSRLKKALKDQHSLTVLPNPELGQTIAQVSK